MAFTRDRVLTFPLVAMLILRGHKFSLQNALNKVFGALGKLRLAPTASAYCQARQKLDPALFQELTTTTAQDFYRLAGQEGSLATWRGHRLLGADGSFLTLPDTPELRKAYTVQRNPITGTQTVQALSVVLYDLRNDLALGAKLGPIVAEKQYLFDLWEQTKSGDVLVLDRLFADYCVIAFALHSGRETVIRCPQKSFGVVRDFWASEATEQVVTLPCPTTPSTRAFVKERNLPMQVRVRLMKFTLPTGETEVLLTTLCDKRRYPTAEFYQVYGWRWGNEMCQSQPVKMTWGPLRLLRLAMNGLRGRFKRENEVDVNLFSGDSDFLDQGLRHGLTLFKRESFKIVAEQFVKGLGVVNHLAPVNGLLSGAR
jgi:hypothetical protein